MKILTILIGSLILSSLVKAAAIEAVYSLKPVSNLTIGLVSLIFDEADCDSACLDWGGHIGKAVSEEDGRRHYNFAGADVYARIVGGALWARWGFGITFFDRTDEHLETPADFHLSLTSGWNITESFSAILGFHHWSNGEGVMEQLGLDEIWRPNGGGDGLLAGISYSF